MVTVKKVSGLFVLFSAMFFAQNALAAGAPLGDPVAGAEKSALCQGCHGGTGNSESAEFPRLAGQYAGYIVKQIKDFKSGVRANNETMAGMAASVESVQDMKDIASYFAQQKMAPDPLHKSNKKLADKGEEIFTKGRPEKDLYACINCHGERGKGKAGTISTFPVIGGQHKDYIIKELKDLQSGLRANDPAGMMSDIAKKLNAEEMDAVAEYLSLQLP